MPRRLSSAAVVAPLLALLVIDPSPALAQRERFQLKLGASYDQGDFGTDDTTHTLFVPVTLRYLGERWDFGVTTSLIYLDAPEEIAIVDGVPVRTDQRTGGRETATGIGDVILRARWFAVDDPGPTAWWPSLTPFVRLKIPTADEDRNLGTGEFDGGLGLEWDKTFGRFFLFGDASFTFMGDPPGRNFRDRPAASIGAGYRPTDTVTVAGLLDWRRALVEGNDDPLELLGVVMFRISPAVTVSPYAFAGLTDGSPDFGSGFEVSYRFGRW